MVAINAAPSFGRLDVLVVENDPDQLSLFTEILAAAGFSVYGAAAPDEALAILRSARVDLLVTDVRLDHDLNGFELANEAQSLQPSLQALFTTGLPADLARQQSGAPPNASILLKVFSLCDFINAVSDALGRSLHLHAISDLKGYAARARSL